VGSEQDPKDAAPPRVPGIEVEATATTPTSQRGFGSLDELTQEAMAGLGTFVRALVLLLEHKSAPAPAVEPWMDTTEAATYAGVREETIREWVRGGGLAAGRAGREIRLKASDIDAYLRADAKPTRRGKQIHARVLEILGDQESNNG